MTQSPRPAAGPSVPTPAPASFHETQTISISIGQTLRCDKVPVGASNQNSSHLTFP